MQNQKQIPKTTAKKPTNNKKPGNCFNQINFLMIYVFYASFPILSLNFPISHS